MTTNAFNDERGAPPGAEHETIPKNYSVLEDLFLTRNPDLIAEINQILTPGERLAILAQPILPGRQIKELSRNNFFNVGHSGNHIRAVTPPVVLFRHFLASMHEPLDPAMDGLLGYLWGDYTARLDHRLPAEIYEVNRAEVDELSDNFVPVNAAVRLGFRALQDYMSDLHGSEFDIPIEEAEKFGKFAVARSVMFYGI